MTQLTGNQIATPPAIPFSNSPGNPAPPAIRGARAFFGEARNHGQQTDGSVTGGSWLQSFPSTGTTTPVVGWDYFEDTARVSSVSDFGVGVTGVARNRGLDGIGVIAAVFAHVPGGDTCGRGWGAYVDGVRAHAATGTVNEMEVHAAHLPSSSPGNSGWTNFWHMGKTPYKAPVSGQVVGIGGSAGSDAAVFGRSYAVDAFMNIGQNGAAFWTGINFMFNSIMREGMSDDRTAPGTTGYARAIGLGYEMGMSWFSRDPSGAPGSGTQEEVIRLFANITDHAHRASLSFGNGGMTYRERSGAGHGIFTAVYNDSVTAGVRAIPKGSASAAVVLEANSEVGDNANLIARGAGTGLFGFGTWASNADAAVNGYVTIVDAAGNSRKLATIA